MKVILFLILATGNGFQMVEQEQLDTEAQCRARGEQYVTADPARVRGYICRGGDRVTARHQ